MLCILSYMERPQFTQDNKQSKKTQRSGISKLARAGAFAIGMLSAGSAMAEGAKHQTPSQEDRKETAREQQKPAENKSEEKNKAEKDIPHGNYIFADKYTPKERKEISEFLDVHYEALKRFPKQLVKHLIEKKGIKYMEREKNKLTPVIAEYLTSHQMELQKIEKTIKDPKGQVEVTGGTTVDDAVMIHIMDFEIRQKLRK